MTEGGVKGLTLPASSRPPSGPQGISTNTGAYGASARNLLSLRDLKGKLKEDSLLLMDGSGREVGRDKEKVRTRGKGERPLRKGAPSLCGSYQSRERGWALSGIVANCPIWPRTVPVLTLLSPGMVGHPTRKPFCTGGSASAPGNPQRPGKPCWAS